MERETRILKMDQIVDKIAALGVPGLVLLVAMAVTGWTGAAAITAALAMLGGPFGMLGGIAVLGLLGLMSQGLAEFGFEQIFQSVVIALHDQGMSKTDIENEVDSYPISKDLKLKIQEYLQKLDDSEPKSKQKPKPEKVDEKKEVRDGLAAQIPDSRIEVPTEDSEENYILTPTQVIEVENVKNYKHAIGQVQIHGLHYPDLEKCIYLFGDVFANKRKSIKKECDALNIIVKFVG